MQQLLHSYSFNLHGGESLMSRMLLLATFRSITITYRSPTLASEVGNINKISFTKFTDFFTLFLVQLSIHYC